MRILIGIVLFSTVTNVGFGQESAPVLLRSGVRVQIRRLAIDSSTLPAGDRERIIHLFERNSYTQAELQARIQQAFRDLGYFKASVDEPKVSFIGPTQGAEDVDVSARVEEGTQYRLGEIRFEKGSIFPADQLRTLFPMRNGDLFSATKISEGLDQLRNLYGTEGYINCVVNPVVVINESHPTIDLVLQLDEGKPYYFGRLFLDGTEPHTGAYKALMESWKTLQGRRYNPVLLKSWLTANASEWPGAEDPKWMITNEEAESHAVDVKLLLR